MNPCKLCGVVGNYLYVCVPCALLFIPSQECVRWIQTDGHYHLADWIRRIKAERLNGAATNGAPNTP